MTALIFKTALYSFLAGAWGPGDGSNLPGVSPPVAAADLAPDAAGATGGGAGNFAKWLFDKKIIGGPPNTYHGCVLGPAAIANAVINLKQRSSLKKTADQLRGVSASAAAAAEYDIMSPYYTTGPDGNLQWDIPPIEVPCPSGGSGCALTDNGESLTNPSGQSMPVSEITKDLPPETLNDRMSIVEEALKTNKDLIAQIQAAQQDSVAAPTSDPAAVAETNSGEGLTGAPTSDPVAVAEAAGNSPAFNFDPLGLQGAAGGGGSGAFAGSSLPSFAGGGSGALDLGGNTPELGPAPDDLFGSDDIGGGGAGAFAGASGFSDDGFMDGGDAEDSASGGSSAAFGGFRFRSGGGSSSAESDNSPPLPFGNDRIASSDTDIFGAVRNRYNSFRSNGQFIPPSSSGPVVRPTLPSSPASSGGGLE